ncbi:3D domain-containing protein [Vagococcus jeotgali]|uniref:3D domain-containing protein n=1 Tax=Vagococcus jeotgali TaxID=3109030 RepID=UPI002DD869B9|nr:3D domain-containing protein [Vagococcus sp. B2T-5]
MLKSKRITIAIMSLMVLFSSPVSLLAAASESDVKKESVEISTKIDKALDDVNAKYRDVENLKTEVSKTESSIESTEQEIKDTQVSIKRRKESIGSRMQNIQSNGSSMSVIDALMNSNSISDFINRAYAITVLQGAEKSKVDSLSQDQEHLEKLKSELIKDRENLAMKQAAVEEETMILENQVSDLKVELSSNEALLNKLANERIVKEVRKEKEAIKETTKATKEEKETSHSSEEVSESSSSASSSEVSSETSESSEESKPSDNGPSPESSNGGTTMTMESTAYSYSEAGASHLTATGIDLRENSRVIAVDPSVIPLNSLVEVSGYGFAIAADTGGAIKGNIVDVHFNTVEECNNWGRRMVSVTVL